MVVKVTLDAHIWKNITESLAALVKEIHFISDDEGIHARAIDEAHIAMVDLALSPNSFTEYHCNGSVAFGVSLVEMTQIMRRSTDDDTLELTVDETKNKLNLKLKSEKATRNFSLSLLGEDSGEDIPIPDIKFDTLISMSASTFKNILKDAEVVGDYITLQATPERIKVTSDGDSGEVEVIIDVSESQQSDNLREYQVKAESQAIYALKYLSDMTKTVGAFDYLKIEYSTDMPLKLGILAPTYQLDYFLAPRIEGGE